VGIIEDFMKLRKIIAALLLALPVAGQVEGPGNLGQNSGQGETRLEIGSWRLVRIETSSSAFGLPRQSKALPIDMRQRVGDVMWGYSDNRRITADFFFSDLKETVTQSNAGVSDAGLRVKVKGAVSGVGLTSAEQPHNDYVAMRCSFDFRSPAGTVHRLPNDFTYGRLYRIYAGTYFPASADRFTFAKKGEFDCGGPAMKPKLKTEEDFTLNYRLKASDEAASSIEFDVMFHFYYRWAGWRPKEAADSHAGNSTDRGTGTLPQGSFTDPGISGAAAPQSRLVRPQKSQFAVGENIVAEYDNPQASGWDWVVIVQPSRSAQALGPHSGVTADHAFIFDNNDNSAKPRAGSRTFPALPEGDYEVRYISWQGGNNRVIAQVPFRVGGAAQPPAVTGTPPLRMPPEGIKPNRDLTGLWINPGGNALYRVRQIGDKLVWGMDAVAVGSYANMFQGKITGDEIDGVWEDLPGSPTIGGGRMLLKIESDCRFVRVSSVNRYGADVWVKKDSLCHVAGLPQKSDAAGAQPATKPKVEEIPDDAAPNAQPTRQPASSTSAQRSEPRRQPPTTQNARPRVEEIPDDAVPPASTVRTAGSSSGSPTSAERTDPPLKREQPPPVKPRSSSSDGGFSGRLGRAINQAITGTGTSGASDGSSQTAGNSGSTTNSGSGGGGSTGTVDGEPGCRGGAWALGTPMPQAWKLGTPGSGVRIPVSHPTGIRASLIRVFVAGTGQQVTWGWNPDLADFCGKTWPLYVDREGYFDVWLYENDRSQNPVAGPVRFQVYR
jgi:hypothetical protein